MYIYFECREGKKRRFYRVTLMEGLWGPILVKEWGRIGTVGRQRVQTFASREERKVALRDVMRRRHRRGYRIVEWNVIVPQSSAM